MPVDDTSAICNLSLVTRKRVLNSLGNNSILSIDIGCKSISAAFVIFFSTEFFTVFE